MDSSAHLGASGHRIASKAGCSSVCSPHAPSSSPDVDGPSYSTSLSTTMLPSSPSSFSPCSSYESSASFSLSSSNSMQADSPSTGRKGLTHSSSWGVAATGASSPSSSPSSSNALGATALAASHSNAAAAAAKAAQSVAVLTGSKPVTAANWSKIGYSSQDQRSGHGERTGPGVCEGRALYTAQHHAGSSQRAVPPSLSSLLLSTPSFSSSNSFPAAFSTLPASPCSQPPLRRPNTQSFAAGTPCGRGVEKAGPTHLSYQHLKSPTAGVSPVPNHPILAGALAGQAAAVAASAAAAAGAAAAKAARTLTEASGTPKNAGAAQPAESKLTPPTYLKPSAGTRIGESSMKAGPVLLTSAPNTEAGRKRDLAASWLQIVCDSAAAQEGKVRRCCSNAPIQPNVLQRQPEKLEGRAVYSSSNSQLRCAADARQYGASWHLFLQSITAAWDTSPSYTRESLHLEKLLQSAIYGAVYRASMHTSRIKSVVVKRTEGEGVEKEAAEDFQIETVSEMVAVKVLSLSLQLNASASLQEDFLSELKFYPYLKGHDNILLLHRVYVDVEQELLFLIFPFAEYEDLFEVLKKRKQPFSESEVRWLCKQLFEAVLELHRRGIGMRDLSLENVLIFRCPKTGFIIPKLTDPGQAVVACPDAAARAQQAAVAEGVADISKKSLSRRSATIKPVYLPPDKIFGKSFRPPEVYRQCRYDPYKIDSFCLGWMVYYLLTKHQLFQRAVPSDDNWRLLASKEASDLLELLGKKNGAVLSVDSLDFIVQLLEEDPHRRLSVQQALEHPFMTAKTMTPVHADRLFPGDTLAQQQHQLRQQHHHQVLLQQQHRLQQQFQQQRLRLQRAHAEEHFTLQPKEHSETAGRTSTEKQQILVSSPESLTVRPSVVKQQQHQRVILSPQAQVNGVGKSRQSSSARGGETHLLMSVPKKSSRHASPRSLARGAGLSSRASSRQGSLAHVRESREMTLRSGQSSHGKADAEGADSRVAAQSATGMAAARPSPDHGKSTQSARVSSPKSGGPLGGRSRRLSRRETSVSSKHDEDVSALRGPSSRSTDVGSTSGETWGCSSDTDYCVRGAASSKCESGTSPSRRKTPKAEASASTISRGSPTCKRAGGTSSRHSSPQKSRGLATGQTFLGSRGSLTIAADHVPTSLPGPGSRKQEGFTGCKRPGMTEQGVADHTSPCRAVQVIPAVSSPQSARNDTALSRDADRKGHLEHTAARPSVAAMVERFQRISSGSMVLSCNVPLSSSGKGLRSPSPPSASVNSSSTAASSRRGALQQSLSASKRYEEQTRSDTAVRRASREREPLSAASPRTLRGSSSMGSSRVSLPPTPPAGRQKTKRLTFDSVESKS